MPDSLLVSPCDSADPGGTVESLSNAYIKQTLCILKHKQLIKSQKDYKDGMLEIYAAPKESLE